MLTTLPPSCAIVMKSGNLNFLEPSGALQACNGTALPLLVILRDMLQIKFFIRKNMIYFPRNIFTFFNKFLTSTKRGMGRLRGAKRQALQHLNSTFCQMTLHWATFMYFNAEFLYIPMNQRDSTSCGQPILSQKEVNGN